MVRSRGQPESRDRGRAEAAAAEESRRGGEGWGESERGGKWRRTRNRTSRDNLIFSNFIRCASIKIQPPYRANTVTGAALVALFPAAGRAPAHLSFSSAPPHRAATDDRLGGDSSTFRRFSPRERERKIGPVGLTSGVEQASSTRPELKDRERERIEEAESAEVREEAR